MLPDPGLLLSSLSHLFFPELCPACENKLDENEKLICTACFKKLKYLPQNAIDLEFESHYRPFKLLDSIYPLLGMEKESPEIKIIYGLKYRNKQKLALYMGELIAYAYPDLHMFDMIVPVPLHKLRLLERGYNQTECIAEGISKITGVPALKVLKKIRYTESQTHKSGAERRKNISSSFSIVDGAEIRGKYILLVDDVLTTGATISECALMLRAAGTAGISAASVALTL